MMPKKTSAGPNEVVRLEVLRLKSPLKIAAFGFLPVWPRSWSKSKEKQSKRKSAPSKQHSALLPPSASPPNAKRTAERNYNYITHHRTGNEIDRLRCYVLGRGRKRKKTVSPGMPGSVDARLGLGRPAPPLSPAAVHCAYRPLLLLASLATWAVPSFSLLTRAPICCGAHTAISGSVPNTDWHAIPSKCTCLAPERERVVRSVLL
jgi:hypothetical protein